jgi:hypothetical protein
MSQLVIQHSEKQITILLGFIRLSFLYTIKSDVTEKWQNYNSENGNMNQGKRVSGNLSMYVIMEHL